MKTFEEMFDRAIAIAILIDHIWQKPKIEYKFLHHENGRITAMESVKGKMTSFPMRYLNLTDDAITTLENAKYKASKEFKATFNKHRGVYIGLKT